MSKRYEVMLLPAGGTHVFHQLDAAIEAVALLGGNDRNGVIIDNATGRTVATFSDAHWHVECAFYKLARKLNKDGTIQKRNGNWSEHAAPLKWTVSLPLSFLTGEPKHDLGQVYLASPKSLPVGAVVRLWGRSWERTASGYVPVNGSPVPATMETR